MRPWGQVELRAVLVPAIASLITSCVTGITTYTAAKGQAVALYEHQQAEQQRAIDRLTQSDLENRGATLRIEASVESLRALVVQSINHGSTRIRPASAP